MCVFLTETVKVKPKKDRDTKPQSKCQPRPSTKKTSNRRSPLKKERNGLSSSNVRPAEPADSQAAPLCSKEGGSEERPLDSSCSPAQTQFQRTLSTAVVLKVHSYAKGDYGDGEALFKEEKRSEGSDGEMEKDSRLVSKAVSG